MEFYAAGVRGVEVPALLRPDADPLASGTWSGSPTSTTATGWRSCSPSPRRSSRSAGSTGSPRRTAPGDEAEVAFLVQDAHQGRGIAQLLLEHLAQAGRERGVKKFVAEVLPENQRMIQIFREAGYQVAGGFEEGVMRFEFPIDSTETSISVMLSREHRAEAASIQRFFDARQRGDHRRLAAAGHRRPDPRAQPRARRLHRPGVRGEPLRRGGLGDAGVQAASPTSRTRSTSRSSPSRPTRSTTSSSTAPPRASTG